MESEVISPKSSVSSEENIYFSQFVHLPKELRLQIYGHAFPGRTLLFRDDWTQGRFNLRINSLGPPEIAQVNQETWDFARTQYQRLTYHALVFRLEHDQDENDQGVEMPSHKMTWFHPNIDVLCIHVCWQYIAIWDRTLHIPLLATYDNAPLVLDLTLENAAYPAMMRALRPFAERANTVAICPTGTIISLKNWEFVPYADKSLFPQLDDVLIMLPAIGWKNTFEMVPLCKHRWSVHFFEGPNKKKMKFELNGCERFEAVRLTRKSGIVRTQHEPLEE